MNFDMFNRWLTLIANLGILIGIYFVAVELNQNEIGMRAQSAADFDDTMIEYARVINANREIWIRGLAGEELTLEDQITFESVGYTVWQKFYGLYSRADLLGGRPREDIALQLAGELYLHPGLKRYFMSRCLHNESLGFNRPFCDDIRAQLARLEQGELDPPIETIYIL